jgi:hypothetical protein
VKVSLPRCGTVREAERNEGQEQQRGANGESQAGSSIYAARGSNEGFTPFDCEGEWASRTHERKVAPQKSGALKVKAPPDAGVTGESVPGAIWIESQQVRSFAGSATGICDQAEIPIEQIRAVELVVGGEAGERAVGIWQLP